MKTFCVYLLALIFCVPAASAGVQMPAMDNVQVVVPQDHAHHVDGDNGHHMHNQPSRYNAHDCCEQDANTASSMPECDLSCEDCGADLSSSGLALAPGSSVSRINAIYYP